MKPYLFYKNTVKTSGINKKEHYGEKKHRQMHTQFCKT